MSLTSKEFMYIVKNNPRVMDDFIPWYNETVQEDVNVFFDVPLKHQLAIWLDYFYYEGIHIVAADEVLVFFRMKHTSVYSYLSNDYKIMLMDIDNNPSESYELAITELIKLINKPF